MAEGGFDYDVALSFAGEDRAYVEAVANFLQENGVRVFYDLYETTALWGKDLYVHLDDVYRNKAQYCVMFISTAYGEKLWTNHERESAQARAFQEHAEYILPARFDDTEIPGIRPTTGYVSLRGMAPEELGKLILDKLGRAAATPTAATSGATEFRRPRLKGKAFNPYDEALRFIDQLTGELKKRCDSLSEHDVSATLFDREGRKCLRIVSDGQVVYSLDVWMGGLGGDSALSFCGVRGEARSGTGSTNAWGGIVWSTEQEQAVFEFHDLSLLGFMPDTDGRAYTFNEFTEALWNVVCDVMEE